MEVIDLEQIKTEEKFRPHKIIQQDEVEVVILPFAPGQGLPVHTTPVDVFFQVLEGRVEIAVGDEVKEVPAGKVVLSPADIPHAVKNRSDRDVKVMVVKTPNPASL